MFLKCLRTLKQFHILCTAKGEGERGCLDLRRCQRCDPVNNEKLVRTVGYKMNMDALSLSPFSLS